MQFGAYTINNKIATIENTALNCFNPYPSSWIFCINNTASAVTAHTASQYSHPATISTIKLGINQFPASGLNYTKNNYAMAYSTNIGGSLQPNWPMTDWYAGVKSAAEMDPISGCTLSTQNTNITGTYTLRMFYRPFTQYILPEGDFRFCFGLPTTANRYGTYYEASEIFVADTGKIIYTALRYNPAITGSAHPTCVFYSGYKSDTFTGEYAGKPTTKDVVPLTANFTVQYPDELTGYGDINGTYSSIIIL